MKIANIAVSYERKFNIGDYNSLKLEATLWADLEEGDDPKACVTALQDQARESVRREFARLKGVVAPGVNLAAKVQLPEPAAAGD